MIVFDWLVFHVLPVCLKFLNVLFQFNTIIVPHSWGIVPNSQSFLAILGGEHDFPLQENSPTSHIRPASISFQQTLSNRWSKFSEFVIEAALLVLDLAEFHCLQMKISESTARQWFCSGIAISWPKLPYIQRYLAFFLPSVCRSWTWLMRPDFPDASCKSVPGLHRLISGFISARMRSWTCHLSQSLLSSGQMWSRNVKNVTFAIHV